MWLQMVAGAVLVPLLFNIYTYYLTETVAKKFAYAANLAIVQKSGRSWRDL